MRSHETASCLPCGHVLAEPDREAWDAVGLPHKGGKHAGPPWTDGERLLWQEALTREGAKTAVKGR